MIDKIFKIGLLILGAVFLFLYYQNIEKGRYYMNPTGFVVLDTQTGTVYKKSGGIWSEKNPVK